MPQLVFHAVPDAAEVDGDHAVEVLAVGLGGLNHGGVNAGVVVGRIEATERAHGPFDGFGGIGLVGDVAADRDRLVPGGCQLVGRRLDGVVVEVGERDRGAGLGECLGGGEADAGAGAGDQRGLVFE